MLTWECKDCEWIHNREDAGIVFAALARLMPESEVDLSLGRNWELFARVRNEVFGRIGQPEEDPEEVEQSNADDRIFVEISNIPGVKKMLQVSAQVESTLLADEEAEENSNPDLPTFNLGLRDVLGKQKILLIAHDAELEAPPDPMVVLLAGRVILGELSRTEHPANANGEMDGGKEFLVYPLKREHGSASYGRPLLVYPPTSFRGIQNLTGVTNVTACTMGHAADAYARKLLGIPQDSALGTVLVGFDVSHSSI